MTTPFKNMLHLNKSYQQSPEYPKRYNPISNETITNSTTLTAPDTKSYFTFGFRILIFSIALAVIFSSNPVLTLDAVANSNHLVYQNGTNATNGTALKPVSSTNCTVDKCIRCVDNTSLTCTSCDSGWYKKTYRGGFKSYDACWSIWKLVLAIIGLLCLTMCCSMCCLYFFKRGKDGLGMFQQNPSRQKTQY